MRVFELLRDDITAPSDAELVSMLKTVNWNYEFDDNERVRTRGAKMMEQIENSVYQAFKVNPDKTLNIWKTFCPWAKKLDESIIPDFIQRFQTIENKK